MPTATATCERCGKPATHHEVEVLGRERVPHHLCDEHSVQRENEPGRTMNRRACAERTATFTQVLQRLIAQHTRPEDFPAQMVFPAGMVPLPESPCSVCGERAVDRMLTVTPEAQITDDVAFCARHTPRRPTRPGRKDWLLSRQPVACDHCDQPARVHVTIPTPVSDAPGAPRTPTAVTQHYCRDHAPRAGVVVDRD